MTAFEVPIYPEESPMIGIPVQYPPKLAANALYGKRDKVIEIIIPGETLCPCDKKCDDTGSGYCGYDCYRENEDDE